MRHTKVLNIRHPGVRTAIDVGTAIYVGRPTIWGNPFILNSTGDRSHVVALYIQHLLDLNLSTEALTEWLSPLRGKDLVCFCAPQLCHAHILQLLISTTLDN